MSPDPDFTAAISDAAAEFRKLFPSPADVEALIRDALARTRAIGGPSGELAARLIEVMNLAHRWNLQAANDPDATIRPGDAAGEIISAINRGLSS